VGFVNLAMSGVSPQFDPKRMQRLAGAASSYFERGSKNGVDQ
jgi:hypothetical protein